MKKILSVLISKFKNNRKVRKYFVAFLVLFLFFLMISVLTFIYKDKIKEYITPAPILVSGTDQKYRYDDVISLNIDELTDVSLHNKNILTFLGDTIFTIHKDEGFDTYELDKGLFLIRINSQTAVIIGNAKFIFYGPSILLADTNAYTLYLISGEEYYADTRILQNNKLVIENDNIHVSATDRVLFTKDSEIVSFISKMKERGILPETLTDLEPPSVLSFSPNPGEKIDADEINIKGTVNEKLSSLAINETTIIVQADLTFESIQKLKIGENTFIFSLTDESGNKFTTEYKLSRKDPCEGNTACGQCGNPACYVPPKPAPTPVPAGGCSASFNTQMLALINQHRIANGLNALVLNAQMNTAACNHSSWMRSTGIFSHTGENGSQFYQRCANAGTSCDAENIAYNSNPSAQAIFNQWKASPGHNANMLGSHTSLGVGLSGIYATTVFK